MQIHLRSFDVPVGITGRLTTLNELNGLELRSLDDGAVLITLFEGQLDLLQKHRSYWHELIES